MQVEHWCAHGCMPATLTPSWWVTCRGSRDHVLGFCAFSVYTAFFNSSSKCCSGRFRTDELGARSMSPAQTPEHAVCMNDPRHCFYWSGTNRMKTGLLCIYIWSISSCAPEALMCSCNKTHLDYNIKSSLDFRTQSVSHALTCWVVQKSCSCFTCCSRFHVVVKESRWSDSVTWFGGGDWTSSIFLCRILRVVRPPVT